MRKCFLHIGTHKTGTTAIQAQLQQQRDLLIQRGFLYPKTGIPDRLSGHHNIAWQLSGDRRFRTELGTVDDLLSEIDQTDRDIILSSEDFECAGDNLGSFINKLEQRRKVEVIVYFRDQLSYARSLYLELITLGYTSTFGEFLLEIVEHRMIRWREWVFAFDYSLLINQLPPGTSMVVRPRQASVIADFLSILGLAPSDVQIDREFRINAQEPISAAIAMLYRNRTGRNLRRDCKTALRAVSGAFDGANVDFSPSDRRRLIASLEASNRWMNERYGLPMLTEPTGDIVNSSPAPDSRLDLNSVFSTVTLKLIEELCRIEGRRKWRFFR